MTAFWMTWKPEGWPIERLRDLIRRFEKDPAGTTEAWRILAHRQAHVGGRAYLFKQGKGQRGIFGVGTIVSEPILDPDQSPDPDHPQHFVDVRFDRLVDPTRSMLLPLDELEDVVTASRIRSQASGTTISDAIAAELDRRLGMLAAGGMRASRPSLRLLTRDAVEKAIGECDDLGRVAFLDAYGFDNARGFWLIYEKGKYDRYDSKAIAGVAFKYVAGVGRALLASELSGGKATVQPVLQDLGFKVEVDAEAVPRLRRVLGADDADNTPYDPKNIEDAREKVLREIRARRGQRKFREALVEAYAGRCAITGCSVLDVLEARAHHAVPRPCDEPSHQRPAATRRSPHALRHAAPRCGPGHDEGLGSAEH